MRTLLWTNFSVRSDSFDNFYEKLEILLGTLCSEQGKQKEVSSIKYVLVSVIRITFQWTEYAGQAMTREGELELNMTSYTRDVSHALHMYISSLVCEKIEITSYNR